MRASVTRVPDADSPSVDAVGRALWSILLLVIGISPILGSAFTPRPFGDGSEAYLGMDSGGYVLAADFLGLGGDQYNRLVGVFITLSTLFLSTIAIFFGLLTFNRTRLPATGLWLGSIALAIAPLLSSYLGIVPNPSLQTIAVPAIFTSAFLLPRVSPAWFITQAKRVLLLYAYGSLCAALVIPQFAVDEPYTGGLIPFLQFRLHGLAPHANSLGVMMILYLALDRYGQPHRRSHSLRASLHLVVVMVTLLLAQSKTNWIILLALFIVYHAYRALVARSLFSHATVMVVILLSTVFLGYLAYNPGTVQGLSVLFEEKDISTLTGRTGIWSYTVQIWRENPLFGYGTEFLGKRMRVEYAVLYGWAPPHAHNQWYQTLGESGILGILTLNGYLIVMAYYGMKYCRPSNALTLMLLILVLIRSFTDVPFRTILADGNLFLHLLIFSSILLVSTSVQRKQYWRSLQAPEGSTTRRAPLLATPSAALPVTSRAATTFGSKTSWHP